MLKMTSRNNYLPLPVSYAWRSEQPGQSLQIGGMDPLFIEKAQAAEYMM
jgi:hypothetical protein